MKQLFFGSVALLALIAAGPAVAADMRVKAPVYKAAAPVATFNWSGCYVGAQVGYAWQRDRDIETEIGVGFSDDTPLDAAKPDGFKAGAFLGCNWQWQGPFVIGIEGDAEFANLKGSVEFPDTGTINDFYESRTRFQASVRARIGYAFERALYFVSGGVAFAHIKHTYVCPDCGLTESFTTTRPGWTVGGGMDYAFTNNWIGRIEYRYADFGHVTNEPVVVWDGFTERHRITEHAVRLGLSYKWGDLVGKGPVVTRY